MPTKHWAIVVGINQYPPLAEQEDLQGAVNDACDFADWALDPDGGNVPAERLYFWTYPWPVGQTGRLAAYLAGPQPLWDSSEGWVAADPGAPPSAKAIVQTICWVGREEYTQQAFAGGNDTSRVYVFLAGHGVRARNAERTEETCFVAGDFRQLNSNVIEGLIPCDSFRRALLHQRFDEAVLFMDCCRSPATRTGMAAQMLLDYDGEPLQHWGLGFAAQDGELAHETGGASVRGAFSSALMNGLRSHRPDGALHVGPLRDYVLKTIGTFTASGQVPNVRCNPEPQGPLLTASAGITLPPRQGPLVDVTAMANGETLTLRDGDNQPVPGLAPFIVQDVTLQMPPLPDGMYLLEADDGSGRRALFLHPSAKAVRVA